MILFYRFEVKIFLVNGLVRNFLMWLADDVNHEPYVTIRRAMELNKYGRMVTNGPMTV